MGDPAFLKLIVRDLQISCWLGNEPKDIWTKHILCKKCEKTLQFLLCKRVRQISRITVSECNEMWRLFKEFVYSAPNQNRPFRIVYLSNLTSLNFSYLTTVHWRAWSHFCCQVYCAVKKHFDNFFFRVLLSSLWRNFFFAIATPLNARRSKV